MNKFFWQEQCQIMKAIPFIFLCLILFGCTPHHRAETYEFPEGFHGWATIVWGAPNYPESPTNQNALVIRFPTNGIFITSTRLEFNAVRNESYFLDAAGNRLSLSPDIGFVGNGFMYDDKTHRPMDYTRIFIGTKTEFQTNDNTLQANKLWESGLNSKLDY
jgi:hypothetical protein